MPIKYKIKHSVLLVKVILTVGLYKWYSKRRTLNKITFAVRREILEWCNQLNHFNICNNGLIQLSLLYDFSCIPKVWRSLYVSTSSQTQPFKKGWLLGIGIIKISLKIKKTTLLHVVDAVFPFEYWLVLSWLHHSKMSLFRKKGSFFSKSIYRSIDVHKQC